MTGIGKWKNNVGTVYDLEFLLNFDKCVMDSDSGDDHTALWLYKNTELYTLSDCTYSMIMSQNNYHCSRGQIT